jgi:hypothetical protein
VQKLLLAVSALTKACSINCHRSEFTEAPALGFFSAVMHTMLSPVHFVFVFLNGGFSFFFSIL